MVDAASSGPPEQRAGSYVLEGELARGGFGAVHRARHAVTGQPAAVKVLHAGLDADRTAVPRFVREVAALLSLSHPGIVEVFEHGCLDEGRPYFAMELLSGVTLAEHLAARGRLSPGEAIDILDPLASALAAAHARSIVHRDLKPSNVFLAEGRARGRVVLLDFGVARLRDGLDPTLTSTRDALGTVAFMAPEQLLGARVDARADVYALGALAYRMLTGEPPFAAAGARQIRAIREHAHPAPPSTRAPIDPALDGPILRALARDADARTATPIAFVEALRGASSARGDAGPGEGGLHTVAVHLEARPIGETDDEALLDELEAALPVASAPFIAAGLVIVAETAEQMLMVDPRGEGGPEARRRIVRAALDAHRRFLAGPGKAGRVSLGIAIHAGRLHASAEGTLLPGGLCDPATWVPAAPRGVVASEEVLAGLDEHAGAPIAPGTPGAPGFRHVPG
ncbi:MAG: serine/threonine-protein kinase [Byssovorax sp.]